MKFAVRTLLLLILACGPAGFVPSPSLPQRHPLSTPAPQSTFTDFLANSSSPQGVTDPSELETFLDDLFLKQMEDYGIAGLTFSLVKDGQVFFQKGYGFADLEKQTPVHPATTIFRTGSVTKLFTWTAVMQLVEQGKLDLDADINTYLDFEIPDTFAGPITLRNLLAHTAGFEELAYDTKVFRYDQIQPLGLFLATHQPARVRPAGQVAVYSNYGANLAGYIVERVSGMPYAEYVETNIFKPLKMEHTTARLPLPPELASQLSTGYRTMQGVLQPETLQIPNTQPDCCISSTAADMANFMIAHLNGGQLPDGNGKILEPATTKQMQTSLWAADERLKGFAYGFMEASVNGQHIFYHSGDINPFHGLLVLIPDQNLGFFISYNTETAGGLWLPDLLGFVDHYYPQERTAPQPPKDFDTRADLFSGYYRPMRGSYTTMEKVTVLKTWSAITPSRDGALLWQPAFQPASTRMIEIGPLLFDSGLTSVFKEDNRHNILYVYDSLPAGFPYEKLPWHANPYLHYGLLAGCSLLFLSSFLAAQAGFFLRLFKRKESIPRQPASQAPGWLAFMVAVLNLLGLGIFFGLFTGSGEAIFYGQTSTIHLMLSVWLLAAILSVPLIPFTVLSWMKRYGRIASRIHHSLVTVSSLAFIWLLSYWNLLGFHY